jgi:hypothetical protein
VESGYRASHISNETLIDWRIGLPCARRNSCYVYGGHSYITSSQGPMLSLYRCLLLAMLGNCSLPIAQCKSTVSFSLTSGAPVPRPEPNTRGIDIGFLWTRRLNQVVCNATHHSRGLPCRWFARRSESALTCLFAFGRSGDCNSHYFGFADPIPGHVALGSFRMEA